MIRCIIFDYGDVLNVPLDPAAWLDHYERLAQQLGMTGEAFHTHLYASEQWTQAKTGVISEQAFWEDRLTPLGLQDASAREAFIDQLLRVRRQIHPLMNKLLHELHANYQLAILSNIEICNFSDWLRDVAHYPVHLFQHIIGSADVGLAKPDPAIYELTLKQLNVAPAQALFIDDKLRNTDAADALGIHTLLFTTPEALQSDLRERRIIN